MALDGLFDIGRSLSEVARSAYMSLRAAVLGGARTAGIPELTTTRRSSALDSLQTAADGLRDAFQKAATKTRPVYATTLYTGQSSSAMLNGAAARVAHVDGYSLLASTIQVNTRPTTIRTSSSALGLDVATAEAASVLRSSSGLGLDVASAEAASTIQSTAEMNIGFDTSYGSSSLTFRNGAQTSSSTGSLTGTYTGTGLAANATSLTVEITQGDTIGGGLLGMGQGDIDFRVTDQNGTVLFTYSGQLGTNETVYLGADIGLTISFSAGTLTTGHTSSTTVTKTPITVSGTAVFNAGAGSRPRFDGGDVVSAGTFKVNGQTITVAANDTINGVLTKINNSGAGVTATLANDRITLTSNGSSEDAIVLSNDTTNFLVATKLSGATTTVGNVRDDQQILKKTSQFSSVADGSFTLNGVAISVDKDTDSLTTVINRINSSGAGVTASFNAATNKVELTTTANSEDLITVANDTSGFLAAAGLSTNNTVRGNIHDDDQVLSKTSQFNDVVTGSFKINGVSISVNKDTDSLSTVISRINAAGAGFAAHYDVATDRLVITPDDAGATLTVDSDTSGFLNEAKIAAGTEAIAVDPDAAFNGTGVNAPHFDPGLTVTAGSFEVNGVTITVDADDSVNSVLAKITASAAGVDAVYNPATELISLTSRDFNAGAITVGNDTSGFLAAVKLDGTAQHSMVSGASAFELAIGEMDEYSAVQAGTLTINGQEIEIDPATTTINGLIDAINGLTNVTAVVDEAGGGITINSAPGGSLTITDTSGILAAFGLAAGTVNGVAGETTALRTQVGTASANTPDVAQDIAKATDALNAALGELYAGRSGDAAFTGAMKESAQAFIDALQREGIEGFGLTAADGAAPTVTVDRAALEKAIDALARPGEARAGMADAVTALAAAVEEAAARPESAGAARTETPARVSMTIQLAQMPALDPAVGQSRARAAMQAREYRRLGEDGDYARPRPIEERPRLTGRVTDPVTITPIDQPGLFEGIVENLLRRLN